MSVYHQNIRIGEYVIISGFSGCRMDIPPFAKAAGYPAALHGANVIGLKRRGFSKEELANIRSAYKLIQAKKNTLTNVANMLEEEFGNDKNIIRLVEFIRTTKRGIYLGKSDSASGSEE